MVSKSLKNAIFELIKSFPHEDTFNEWIAWRETKRMSEEAILSKDYNNPILSELARQYKSSKYSASYGNLVRFSKKLKFASKNLKSLSADLPVAALSDVCFLIDANFKEGFLSKNKFAKIDKEIITHINNNDWV